MQLGKKYASEKLAHSLWIGCWHMACPSLFVRYPQNDRRSIHRELTIPGEVKE